MYNYLVTAQEGAWDLPVYEYDSSRFLEYTSDSLKARFRDLTAKAIDEIKSFPAMFAYERRNGLVRIGYLRTIRERGRSLRIQYEMDESITPFSFDSLLPHLSCLDIDDWELARTHWAIKDEDLFEILASIDLVDQTLVGEHRQTGRVEELPFKVALSFSGEKRTYVAAVVAELKKRIGPDAVFYDHDYTAQLARPNLDTLLQRIYLNNSDLVVVFLCADYEQKQWCGLEWRAIRNIIKNKNDHAIMFMRFDAADVSGVFSIDGNVDLDQLEPAQAARMIAERVRLN